MPYSVDQPAPIEGPSGRSYSRMRITKPCSALHLHYDKERPSPFLLEAGVLSSRKRQPRVAPSVPLALRLRSGSLEGFYGAGARAALDSIPLRKVDKQGG